MRLNIAKIIRQKLDDSGIPVTKFAEMTNMSRSNANHLFNRENNITIELLYSISTILKYDFFKLISDSLKKEMNILDGPISKDDQPEREHRVMIEVTLSDKEYQDLIRKRIMK